MHEFAEIYGYKHTIKGTELHVVIPKKSIGDYLKRFGKNGKVQAELRLDDGRTISVDQRKKTYATIRDIADYTGHAPEELKELLKYYYMAETGENYFSLSDCTMTTARMYINYLLEFAFRWDIPLAESGLDRTDDINAYLYMCIKYRKCCLCGGEADIHHVQAIGMGRDRKDYDDSKHEKVALCRRHHSEAHQSGWQTFKDKNHIYGIIYQEDDRNAKEEEKCTEDKI